MTEILQLPKDVRLMICKLLDMDAMRCLGFPPGKLVTDTALTAKIAHCRTPKPNFLNSAYPFFLYVPQGSGIWFDFQRSLRWSSEYKRADGYNTYEYKRCDQSGVREKWESADNSQWVRTI